MSTAVVAPIPTGTPSPAPEPTTAPLSALRTGSRARIASLSQERGRPLTQRLADLGFMPGREVEVVRHAPLGDPVIYRVADYEICLRKRDTALILVEAAAR